MLVFYISIFLALSLTRKHDWRVFELFAFLSPHEAYSHSPKLTTESFTSQRIGIFVVVASDLCDAAHSVLTFIIIAYTVHSRFTPTQSLSYRKPILFIARSFRAIL